jgi:thymidylate synthase
LICQPRFSDAAPNHHYELLWFLKGDVPILIIWENGVKIWDDWAK